ncbi:hypothetical protein V8C26DRAFT_382429 [Trichoderma gracile]
MRVAATRVALVSLLVETKPCCLCRCLLWLLLPRSYSIATPLSFLPLSLLLSLRWNSWKVACWFLPFTYTQGTSRSIFRIASNPEQPQSQPQFQLLEPHSILVLRHNNAVITQNILNSKTAGNHRSCDIQSWPRLSSPLKAVQGPYAQHRQLHHFDTYPRRAYLALHSLLRRLEEIGYHVRPASTSRFRGSL